MTEVHTHDTVLLPVSNLTLQHTLVGESGGLSAVYDVTFSAALGQFVVETEHGYLHVAPDAEMTVLA